MERMRVFEYLRLRQRELKRNEWMGEVISVHFEEVTGIEKWFELIGSQGVMLYLLILLFV